MAPLFFLRSMHPGITLGQRIPRALIYAVVIQEHAVIPVITPDVAGDDGLQPQGDHRGGSSQALGIFLHAKCGGLLGQALQLGGSTVYARLNASALPYPSRRCRWRSAASNAYWLMAPEKNSALR